LNPIISIIVTPWMKATKFGNSGLEHLITLGYEID